MELLKNESDIGAAELYNLVKVEILWKSIIGVVVIYYDFC